MFLLCLYLLYLFVVLNVNVQLYRWQERDFESTSLTDDSWANVVFRSRPSALATKTRKGFPLSYLGSNKSIFLIGSLKRWQGGSDSVSECFRIYEYMAKYSLGQVKKPYLYRPGLVQIKTI